MWKTENKMIIKMNLGNDSYDIVLERGALNKASEYLNLNRRVLIVTDDGVPAVYCEKLAAQCKSPVIVTIPQGEGSKHLGNFEKILEAALEAGFTRKDCVAAVGGGVVGDMSGFAAACYMRGIDFYNVPTTLLSQVDSSIGGKTAIDFKGVKNIVGAFYQPKKVIIDPDTLRTLEDRQVSAGLAEAIKMAATYDRELFEFIERSENLEMDLTAIIKGALLIKKDVVEQDPKEKGLRKILNFGHTVGHAIESYYAGRYLHGECVAMGMLPMCSGQVRERIRAVLEKYDLPTSCDAGAEELMPFVMHDKKMQSSTISVICVPEIGKYEIRDVEPSMVSEYIRSAELG